jgi:hypothetical protein
MQHAVCTRQISDALAITELVGEAAGWPQANNGQNNEQHAEQQEQRTVPRHEY